MIQQQPIFNKTLRELPVYQRPGFFKQFISNDNCQSLLTAETKRRKTNALEKIFLDDSKDFLPLLTIWLNYIVKVKKIDQTTEQKILAAAKKVFISQGMAGARMQDIADEADINKAMLHYYFRSKEKLFEVIFSEAAGKLFPRVNMLFESDLPLFEKIEKFVSEYIDVIIESPYLPMFVLNEIHRNPEVFLKKIWKKENMPHPEKFLEQIEKEIKKGTIKRISPLQLLLNLLSLTIFPFIARPMFQTTMSLDELQFRNLMNQRKTEVPKFIIDAIRK